MAKEHNNSTANACTPGHGSRRDPGETVYSEEAVNHTVARKLNLETQVLFATLFISIEPPNCNHIYLRCNVSWVARVQGLHKLAFGLACNHCVLSTGNGNGKRRG